MVSVIQQRTAVEQEPTVVTSPSLADVWRRACDDLGNAPAPGACDIEHDVTISLDMGQGGVRTQYRAALEARGLPAFTLTKRGSTRSSSNDVRTGDAKFDKAALIKTNDPLTLASFMNAERRMSILQLMAQASAVEITNTQVVAWSTGIEREEGKANKAMHRVLDVAETVRPCWTEVALDEGSVVDDLFHSKRDVTAIEKRFDELYLGSAVNWTGEVLTVGATDSAGQRAAVLVAAAHGASSSGRVVALTALDPQLQASKGDVVSVTGCLWNLNADKRLFTIE